MNFADAAFVAAAYFLGAAPFSVFISRAFGLGDPRAFGSGNPGATNVARRNKAAALLTLLADAGKGFLPVYFAADALVAAAAGLAAVVGHVFSVFLRLRGGKGVATALGAFCAWHWPAGLAGLAAWALMFALFRISSVSSLTALVVAAAGGALAGGPAGAAGVAAALLSVFRHRRNIADLARGRERGFGGGGRRRGRSFAARMLVAFFALAGVLTVVGYAHDYPLTRRQVDLIRSGDAIAANRPWIAVFFFLNEAGDGMKYMLTGNEKYMRHYPSTAYLLERQRARAENNRWRQQEWLAMRYRSGDGVLQNDALALSLMRRARKNAPADGRARLAAVIREWENADAAPPVN